MQLLQTRKIIDISPVISTNLAVFPGDTRFTRKVALDMNKGHNLTLSAMESTLHLGAHTDAPNHYSATGASIEQLSLEIYIGPAQVIEIKTRKGERIQISDLENIQLQAPRVLFKTLSFPNPNQWSNDFMALSAEVINYVSQKGVRLVGIDTPSIDLASDKILESHNAVAQNDMAILEGIVLENVVEGFYDLIALPLPILGADASPVRAILLK